MRSSPDEQLRYALFTGRIHPFFTQTIISSGRAALNLTDNGGRTALDLAIAGLEHSRRPKAFVEDLYHKRSGDDISENMDTIGLAEYENLNYGSIRVQQMAILGPDGTHRLARHMISTFEEIVHTLTNAGGELRAPFEVHWPEQSELAQSVQEIYTTFWRHMKRGRRVGPGKTHYPKTEGDLGRAGGLSRTHPNTRTLRQIPGNLKSSPRPATKEPSTPSFLTEGRARQSRRLSRHRPALPPKRARVGEEDLAPPPSSNLVREDLLFKPSKPDRTDASAGT